MIIIEDIQKTEVQQSPTVTEVRNLDELRNLVNKLPDGTVYSINLEVIEIGQKDGKTE